jgi:RND family efflux transporter MFP subunit
MMQPVESDQTNSPASKPAALPPRGKLWHLLAVGAVAAALFAAAFIAGRLPRLRQHEVTTRESSELAIPVVTVVSPTPGAAASGLLLPAEVKPWIETPIYARASGYLKRWLVDLGDRVQTGQLLCEIETPELDQELERARHELAQAEAALALAKTKAARSAKLVEPGGVSREEYDQDQAEVAMKTAMVSAARANVCRLEELHSFARVTAPFSGIITARKTDVGELIAAGSARELFRLAQVDHLRVRVRVPQSRSLAITPDQTAELLVPELPGKIFTAKVARTAGAISPDSRTLLTELEVDNTRGELLAGGFAQVRFAKTKGDTPLTLPSNTLLFRAEGPQVGVVQADGTVQLRSVTLGRDFGRIVEILGGVDPTDRVILNPSDSLVAGTSVRPEMAR